MADVLKLVDRGTHDVLTAVRHFVEDVESGTMEQPDKAAFVTLNASGEVQVYGMGAGTDVLVSIGLLNLGIVFLTRALEVVDD